MPFTYTLPSYKSKLKAHHNRKAHSNLYKYNFKNSNENDQYKKFHRLKIIFQKIPYFKKILIQHARLEITYASPEHACIRQTTFYTDTMCKDIPRAYMLHVCEQSSPVTINCRESCGSSDTFSSLDRIPGAVEDSLLRGSFSVYNWIFETREFILALVN